VGRSTAFIRVLGREVSVSPTGIRTPFPATRRLKVSNGNMISE